MQTDPTILTLSSFAFLPESYPVAAPTFVIKLSVCSSRDGTSAPRLLLEVRHSDRVETEHIPADETFPTEQEALKSGKALAAVFMQFKYPGQMYDLE